MAFAVVGGVAASKASSLEDQCPNDECPPELEGDLDESRGLADAATGLLVAGSIVTALGATLVILSASADEEEQAIVRLRVVPTGAVFAGRW